MTINDQEKLLKLQANGHRIKINIGPYIDGFGEVYRRADGKIVFDSHVYSDVELDTVSASKVGVFKVVDNWQEDDEFSDALTKSLKSMPGIFAKSEVTQ